MKRVTWVEGKGGDNGMGEGRKKKRKREGGVVGDGSTKDYGKKNPFLIKNSKLTNPMSVVSVYHSWWGGII